MSSSTEHCELCGRVRPLTFHHLIPRRLHANKWFRKNHPRADMAAGIDVCRDCHLAIHQFITHKELGRLYNTKEKLQTHPKLAAFIAWVRTRHGKMRYRTRRAKK